MSLFVSKLRCLSGLQKPLIPPRDAHHNLKRHFALLNSSSATGSEHCVLVSIECHRAPSRSFHKHKVEVEKRIQWTRPTRVRCILPQKSGDMSGLPEVDPNQPPPLFKDSKEYQTANDLVKRVFSLRFQPSSLKKEAQIESMMQKVRRHKLDFKSVEVKIAKYTAIIRNMQVHFGNYPRDSLARADLKEIIEFRKKRLKLLRSLDYKRFEWLLETLDLLYKPPPTLHERVERKKCMRYVATDYIEKVKAKKLQDYRTLLDSQKTPFLQSKLSMMKAIVEEEKSFGVEPSFTEGDIAEVEEALRQKLEEDEKISPTVPDVKETY